jgi:hypothetical protein
MRENKILIDEIAEKKQIKKLQISSRIFFLLSLPCFLLLFFDIPWWPWRVVLIIATLAFLLLGASSGGNVPILKDISFTIQSGETSIANIVEATKQPESEVRRNLRKMIEMGILLNTTIFKDELIPKNMPKPPFPMSTSTNKETVEAKPEPQAAGSVSTPVNDDIISKTASDKRVDLNAANEFELANLPGVSVALAKKAIELRTENGAFSTVNDFCQQLGLMPHHATQIDDLAYADPDIPKEPPAKNLGRMLDI